MGGTSSGGTLGDLKLAPALRELLLAACLLPMFGPTQLQYPNGLPDPRLNSKNYKSVKWLIVIGFHSKASAENPKFSTSIFG